MSCLIINIRVLSYFPFGINLSLLNNIIRDRKHFYSYNHVDNRLLDVLSKFVMSYKKITSRARVGFGQFDRVKSFKEQLLCRVQISLGPFRLALRGCLARLGIFRGQIEVGCEICLRGPSHGLNIKTISGLPANSRYTLDPIIYKL